MEIFLWSIAILAVAAGLIGAIVPALPGSLLVFAGLVAGAWADDFERVGFPTLAILLFLTALSYAAEAMATAWGARKTGSGRWGVAGALVGSIVGMFFGLAGILIGPFVGAVAGEYYACRDIRRAGHAGAGTWLGLVVGSALKAALSVMMIGIFLLVWLSGG